MVDGSVGRLRSTAAARAGVVAAFAAQGWGFAIVLTHLTAFKSRWGLDDLGITGIMFAVALIAAAGSVVAGALATRSGSAAVLRGALLVAATGLFVTGMAGSLGMFLAGVAVYGLGLGLVDASENMQAVALEAVYGRSVLTSFHASWSAGGIAGAVYGSLTGAAHWSLPAVFVPAAVLVALTAAAPLLGHDGEEESAGAPGEAEQLAAKAAAIPWRRLGLLGLALVLFYIADSAASSWSTIYLQDTLGAGVGLAPLAYAAYQTTGLISRLSGDQLVRRRGPVRVVRWAATIGVIGLGAVVLAPGPIAAIIGFAVLGAGMAVVAPLTFSAAGALADGATPGQRRRQADAIVARLNQFNYLGFVLGGVLTGLVSSAGSLRWGFVVPWVLTAVLIALAPAFGQREPVGS